MPFTFKLKKPALLEDLEPLTCMQVRNEGVEYRQFSVLDSVDWSIWLSGLVLINTDKNRLELISADGTCQASATIGLVRGQRLARELPEPLASKLKQLISVRALIPQFNCQWREHSLAFLNADDKTVVRATLYHIDDSSTESLSLLQLRPLRGYDREALTIQQALEPVAATIQGEINLRFLLQQCGLTPTPVPTKPEFQLKDHQPTEEAVLKMILELLFLARRQEEGLIADIDSEFAHQYRVNLRKARSLLSLFKKDLSPERFRAIQLPLKNMAKNTNLLRDLDVFLLDQDDYLAMLPEQFQSGLEALFKRLKRRRRQVWRKVTAILAGKDYREKTKQLERLINEPPEFSTSRSQAPIKKRVCRKILSQYDKIQRHGAHIDATTPDEQIHELRIEAKKLRYLLELFAELFSKDQVRRLIKALKRLQDNLGRFNDYSSQCLFLEILIPGVGTKTAERDAISGLIAVLYNKQKNEREQVVDMITAFSSAKISEQFQKLFACAAAKDSGS